MDGMGNIRQFSVLSNEHTRSTNLLNRFDRIFQNQNSCLHAVFLPSTVIFSTFPKTISQFAPENTIPETNIAMEYPVYPHMFNMKYIFKGSIFPLLS